MFYSWINLIGKLPRYLTFLTEHIGASSQLLLIDTLHLFFDSDRFMYPSIYLVGLVYFAFSVFRSALKQTKEETSRNKIMLSSFMPKNGMLLKRKTINYEFD
jgi:hypothetical protein